MDLSIIVPVYNSNKYLGSCLQSICSQIKKNVEIILINDCSKDNSLQISKRFKKKYNFINLTSLKKNKGVSFCRNLGLKKSKGKFIFFVDSDDLLPKNTIQNITKQIKSSPNVDLFFHKNIKIPKNEIDSNQFVIKKKKNSILENIKNFESFRATCWNFIIKKDFLIKNKIFFKKIITFEDQVFVSQILCQESNYKIINKVYYKWRNYETNTLGKKIGYLTASSCLKILIEISKMIKNEKIKLNSINKKFLISRAKFSLIRFFQNILICDSMELEKLNASIKKNKMQLKSLSILGDYKTLSKPLTDLQTKNLKLINKEKISNIIKKNLNNKKIILICLGYYGKIILKVLKKLTKKIDLIIDNNKQFNGKSEDKIKIKNYLFLKKNIKKYQEHTLAICQNKKKEIYLIKKRLLNMKFNKKNITHIEL